MKLIAYFVVILCNIEILSAFVSVPITKDHESCDEWATAGECVANPGYLWTSCQTSCIELALDDVECEEWSQQGECTNNPGYIHIHCPTACGRAIAWSYWARRSIGIDDILPFHEDLSASLQRCLDQPSMDLLSAADIVATQLSVYLEGGARVTPSLASTAPSEYLGMMGLTEAFLYSLRLYDIVVRSTTKISTVIPQYIEAILDVVRQGYSSDVLMRTLSSWIVLLEEARTETYVAIDAQVPTEEEICPGSTRNSFSLKKLLEHLPSKSTLPSKIINAEQSSVKLNNGVVMPLLGLGTWQLEGEDCEVSVIEAIRQGYRHIDTAEAYRNEASVGWGVFHALRLGYATRDQLFIATKLSDSDKNGGYLPTKRLIEEQLKLLQVEYIDLYMLHSPFEDKTQQLASWTAMEEAVAEGKIRSLGVSNFDQRELEQLISSVKIKPAVVQNKGDVYHVGKQLDNQGDKIVSYTRAQGIVLVAYSSFSAYPFVMIPTQDPIIRAIALEKLVTPSQVILRWQLQHGMAVIPRSSNPERLEENLAALTIAPLTDEEMSIIDTLQYLVASPVSVAVNFE